MRRSCTSVRSSSPAIAQLRGRRGVERDLAALERDRDGVHAVARLQLADDVAHVGADGLDRHAELVADRLGRAALGHQVHDLALARRELRARWAVARGESRMRSSRGSTYEPPAATCSIAPTQLLHRAGLQRVAARAGVEAAVEQLGVGVARVEDHAEVGAAGEQLARELDAAAVGQADVDDRHVGLGVLDEVERRRRRCPPRRRPPCPCPRSSATSPSRRASWSSTITSLVIGCAEPSLRPRTATKRRKERPRIARPGGSARRAAHLS